MYWLSWVVIAIIVGGLLVAYKTEMYVTQIFMIQNLLIFILVYIPGFMYPGITSTVYSDLAGRAIYITSLDLFFNKFYTFISLMFLHGGIFHIGMNIVILFLIGIPLEDRIGKEYFILVYFLGGIIATFGQYIVDWGGIILNLGASGAVMAIMGTLVFMYPKDKITMFVGPILMRDVRVDFSVAIFIMIQTVYALFMTTTNIAHAAHFAGFGGGILLGVLIKRMGVEIQKTEKLYYDKLSELVNSKEQKEIYKKIIEADEEEVKKAWSEYLIRRANCPECGRNLKGEECECGYNVWED